MFRVRHKAGKSNLADFLSRQPFDDEKTGGFAAISKQYVIMVEDLGILQKILKQKRLKYASIVVGLILLKNAL